MKAARFRVQNFRNVDDSGWIKLERITCFVGRNESGKTTLLKALHKFNPAVAEPYDPQREFPRDRYTRDYVAKGSKGGDWPVCSVAFSLEELSPQVGALLESGVSPPTEVIVTRHYDGSLKFDYTPKIAEGDGLVAPAVEALAQFASGARRLPAPVPEQEETTAAQRTTLSEWATAWQEKLKAKNSLRNPDGTTLLADLCREANEKANPQTADLVETLLKIIEPMQAAAKAGPIIDRLNALVQERMPVLIYFENYGILDSSVWLPRFLEDLNREPTNPRVRTINAMFRHVGLDPKEITELGSGPALDARARGQNPTPEQVAADERRSDERAIRLNSASIDISERFSAWWSQRRHKIRYHADGAYFQIWVADDRRPDVEIELEARSKGFQWFFSFYLVFLVESEEGHKDAILLLDEPGLDLHPTAQQGLITFFEKLAEKNQVLYTTHSPFLIDGEHLERVRPVTEDSTGHSRITAETWPKDRETIFPLQAAAGYAMIRGLFRHRKNVLVEGMSDYYYLHALAAQCGATGRSALPKDIYITACGGTKLVGHLAALFSIGQDARPVVLLDGDEAGRVRQSALMKELYVGHGSGIVMLDEALGRPGEEVAVEDILGEAIVVPAVNMLVGRALNLTDEDRKIGGLPDQIKAAAKRDGIELPDGWKASIAISLVSEWAEKKTTLPGSVLDTASQLFSMINDRFNAGEAA